MADIAIETTPDRILDACEALIRRHGPAKATVVDVARALDMSHANVYRHFPSKAALREAVTERWLNRVSAPLAAVAAGEGPASARLAAWIRKLAAIKREKVLGDPELFAAYRTLAAEHTGVAERHVKGLVAQLAAIVADGMAAGEFVSGDAVATAVALLDASSAFHHPQRVGDTAGDPDVDARLETVIALLIGGLKRPA